MSLLERKEFSLIPIFIVGTTVIQATVFGLTAITFGKIDRIAKAKIPTMTELCDGSTARTIPLTDGERSPVVISTFTGRKIVDLMSWSSVLKNTGADNVDSTNKQQPDEGIAAGEGKVTSATWAAAFALSEDFRATFLTTLAKLTPPTIFEGKAQSLLIVRHLSQPQKILEGQWKLNLIANLVMFENSKQVGKAIAFNKTIFVRAIDTPLLPQNATELQQIAYRARKDGLEIYKITEMVQE